MADQQTVMADHYFICEIDIAVKIKAALTLQEIPQLIIQYSKGLRS